MTATPDAMPHSVLPTMLDHCTPAIRGKDDDFHDPLRMYTVPPCVYKRRRRASFKGVAQSDHFDRTQHSAPLSLRYWNMPQSTPSLTETWELPSLSRLAYTPYYRHLRCKIIQCPRTPPCWTYGPTAGTRINPCVTVLPLASAFGTRKHTAFTSWDPDPRVRTPKVGAPGRGTLRDIFSLVLI